MRNPNGKILLIVLLLILIVGGIGFFGFRSMSMPQQRVDPDPPAAAENTAVPGTPQGYLRVQVGSLVYDPLPLTEGGEYTIKQGEDKVNVIRTTATGAVMHSSTCDNQSCVEQGEVTLENRDSRVLMNMIICLPNEVVLEVLTPEEAEMEAVQ